MLSQGGSWSYVTRMRAKAAAADGEVMRYLFQPTYLPRYITYLDIQRVPTYLGR